MSRSFVPDSRLACIDSCLCHAVLRESQEDPLKESLPHLVEDFSSPLFLQDRVAVYSQDVVDAADSQTFSLESIFRLRVLTQLDTFVHNSNNVRPWPRAGPR